MSYLEPIFTSHIDKNSINIILELGSRDLQDAIKLLNYYNNSKIYSFECNPDCLVECHKQLDNLNNTNPILASRIELIENAVSLSNGEVNFFPFDLKKYNNMGASSMLKIDFSKRNKNDPDYQKTNPQKQITVKGIRLETFIENNSLNKIDIICMDLQGYELNALQSLGKYISQVKYIITETSIVSTYENGAIFSELNEYLEKFGFKYCSSNLFLNKFPDLKLKGYSEFDVLFVNVNL
jgi:FkbM family methyltransferase